MPDDDNLQRASEYAKAAILRMEFLGLPPGPRNYALMYAYASNRPPELKAAVDEAVRKGGLTEARAQELYDRHLGDKASTDKVEESLKSVASELSKIASLLGVAQDGSNRFANTLDNFGDHLGKPMSIEDLSRMVARVSAETRAIAESNHQMRQQLDMSAQELMTMQVDLSKARRETMTDPLTGVGNRKFLTTELQRLAQEAHEQHTPLALVMTDIDHFKKFNDTHGHLIGDQVLKLVGRTLMENLKGRDVVARYGGEEFVILLPLTKLTDAAIVAESLRAAVASKKIVRRDINESLGAITISMGVAQLQHGEKLADLMRRADGGLYAAKAAGRNRVIVQTSEADLPPVPKGGESFDELDAPAKPKK